MLPSFFTTNRIIKDPFNLSPLRTDIVDKLKQKLDEENAAISPEKDFGDLLLKAFDNVNTQQLESGRLGQKMLTDPNSVDIHDITIAGAKATLSLSITKELMDRALRAYKEIINVR